MKVMTTISGIDAAPSDVTMTGAMPVTRIVAGQADDERAPPVRLLREPSALVLEHVGVCPGRPRSRACPALSPRDCNGLPESYPIWADPQAG